ncbi:hypothetical protein H7I77_25045 [Mycolicibacterium novocastrense]|uniref:Uncharacterized protein n=1 Tax=Mycolicibacterium novocastrense TaxID=59813 RepID=A0AAW5SQM1_MYCNV|nr:hypothetical protein [Mycolicibacterium novocastrense]MCV7026579.1 hypothetical protein [Mycolicibacterium novocastrense]
MELNDARLPWSPNFSQLAVCLPHKSRKIASSDYREVAENGPATVTMSHTVTITFVVLMLILASEFDPLRRSALGYQNH